MPYDTTSFPKRSQTPKSPYIGTFRTEKKIV